MDSLPLGAVWGVFILTTVLWFVLSPNEASKNTANADGGTGLRISQLYIYPIKSLRGIAVSSATLTKFGFAQDRQYLLLKVLPDNKVETMHVSHVSQMCLFHTAIKDNNIIISYHPPKGSSEKAPPELTIPLKPNCKDLKTVDVTMHGSPSVAYNMGPKCNEWFSSIFGYEVILANWGGNARSVLGNLPNRPASEGPSSKSPLMKALGNIPLIGSLLGGPEDEFIAFNDCAPFLVTTEESKAAVSTRFAPGVEMDMKLFRPNIVLTGSPSEWDEDYWGELSITSAASPGNKAKIILTANCARCASLTVDYETGKHGTGPTGDALKVLMKDRRVDPGSKWSPIFGRYGFLRTADDGKVLNVEDKVLVSKRLNQRTIFHWPGLSTA